MKLKKRKESKVILGFDINKNKPVNYGSQKYSSKFKRTVIKNKSIDKIIIHESSRYFDRYKIQVYQPDDYLSIQCVFVDNDDNDIPINREVKITRKAALYLVKDLIKFIITKKI